MVFSSIAVNVVAFTAQHPSCVAAWLMGRLPNSLAAHLCTPFEHGPEIGAGALRFELRGVGRFAQAEIAVD